MDDIDRLIPAPGTSELAAAFWAAVAVSVFLPRITYGKYLMYPFALLGTWAHESGHGVAAMLVGGKFKKLEIYSNLGGVAYSSGVGDRAHAFVAAGGLLGPALAGGAIILFGAREETAQAALIGLSIVVALSLVFFVRNKFGFFALAAIAAAMVAAGILAPRSVGVLLTQLVGIQFCVASWNTLDYMFTKNFKRNGKTINSDTQDIAEALFLPYWFWGAVIAAASFCILAGSYYLAWVRPL